MSEWVARKIKIPILKLETWCAEPGPKTHIPDWADLRPLLAAKRRAMCRLQDSRNRDSVADDEALRAAIREAVERYRKQGY